MTQPSPIQWYLEDLRDRLAAVPDCDRILAEAEDHLVEAAAELQQTGLPATEAERSATLRFCEPQAVAERFIRQFKQGEMMHPKKNLRGVRILAAVFAFTAVTQSAGAINAAIRVNSLFGFALLQPLIHVVLAYGLWRHRSWSRNGLMVWSAVMAVWGAVLVTQGLVGGILPIAEMLPIRETLRIPSAMFIGWGSVTICIAAAMFKYMRSPGVRLHLTE